MIIQDFDNGKIYEFVLKGVELYYFNVYETDENDLLIMDDSDYPLTRKEVKKYHNGKDLIDCIDRYYCLDSELNNLTDEEEEERKRLYNMLFCMPIVEGFEQDMKGR